MVQGHLACGPLLKKQHDAPLPIDGQAAGMLHLSHHSPRVRGRGIEPHLQPFALITTNKLHRLCAHHPIRRRINTYLVQQVR